MMKDFKVSEISTCQNNQLKWRYALAGSCFSSSESMTFIHKKLHKNFIVALKTNRLVALNLDDKKQGHFVRVDALQWSEEPVQGWVKQVGTQSNPVFMSLFVATRLETLSIKRKITTFALKNRLYIKAIRQALNELQKMKEITA